MTRMVSMAALVSTLVACSGGPGSAAPEATGAGGSTDAVASDAAASSAAGGGDVLAAAQAITEVCPLIPADLAAAIVPNASAPHAQTFPPFRCTISNGTQVLEVTMGGYDTGRPTGAPTVSGFDAGAFAEHLNNGDPGEVYLTVLLTPEVGSLYVEIVDPSSPDRTDDAVAMAKAVLAAMP